MSSPYACYVFINTRLPMEKGKIAAQCMHAMRMAMNELPLRSREIREIWKIWEKTGSKTITLKAENEAEMATLISEYPGIEVRDAGCTQVPPDSFTVALLFPMEARSGGFQHNGKRYKLY